MSVVVGILVLQARETKSEVPTIKNKKVENRLDKLFPFLYNGNNEANNKLAHYKEADTKWQKSKSDSRSLRRSLAFQVRFRKLSRTATVRSVFVLM